MNPGDYVAARLKAFGYEAIRFLVVWCVIRGGHGSMYRYWDRWLWQRGYNDQAPLSGAV